MNYVCWFFDGWGLFFFIHTIFSSHSVLRNLCKTTSEMKQRTFLSFIYFIVLIGNWWRPKERGISIIVFKTLTLLRDVAYLYNLFLQAFGIILNHWVSLNLKFPCLRILYCISADTVLDALIRNFFQITLWSFLDFCYCFLTLINIQGKQLMKEILPS